MKPTDGSQAPPQAPASKKSNIDRPAPKKPKKRVKTPEQIARLKQRQAEWKLKKLEQRRDRLDATIERGEARVDAFSVVNNEAADKRGKIITDEQFDLVEYGIPEDVEIIFKPNPGPQTDFFEASEQEVLYGGAAGGGKSFAVVIDAVRDAGHGQHRAIVFRRYLDELRELIGKSKELYPQMFPGAKWSKQEGTWTFPSGATIWFTYLENEDDVTRYQGQAFNYIAFDELGQWPTSYCWDYMRSRLRTTAPDLRLYMRATANPGGAGGHWVKKMFIDPAPPGKAFFATDMETGFVLTEPSTRVDGSPNPRAGQPLFKRRFIPAKLSDNPYLFADGQYEKNLLSLPEHLRKRLLEGDWDVVEGAAFPEFNRLVHVVEPFKIPGSWVRFRAADYGFRSPACVLWMALDGEGRLFVYRELYGTGMDTDEFAKRIQDIEAVDGAVRYGILDSSMWDNRGNRGPTPAETWNARPYSLHWRQSDRSKNSRVAGKLELHRRLKPTTGQLYKADDGNLVELPGRPMLQIFSTCVNLIRTLPTLPIDKNNPEDVDTDSEDHAYDALRYGCMSRPLKPDFGFSSMFPARVTPVRPYAADKQFGY